MSASSWRRPACSFAFLLPALLDAICLLGRLSPRAQLGRRMATVAETDGLATAADTGPPSSSTIVTLRAPAAGLSGHGHGRRTALLNGGGGGGAIDSDAGEMSNVDMDPDGDADADAARVPGTSSLAPAPLTRGRKPKGNNVKFRFVGRFLWSLCSRSSGTQRRKEYEHTLALMLTSMSCQSRCRCWLPFVPVCDDARRRCSPRKTTARRAAAAAAAGNLANSAGKSAAQTALEEVSLSFEDADSVRTRLQFLELPR